MSMPRTEREANVIRGKMLVGHATVEEQASFLGYVDELEALLAEADLEDFFGSEGWRHRIGWDS